MMMNNAVIVLEFPFKLPDDFNPVYADFINWGIDRATECNNYAHSIFKWDINIEYRLIFVDEREPMFEGSADVRVFMFVEFRKQGDVEWLKLDDVVSATKHYEFSRNLQQEFLMMYGYLIARTFNYPEMMYGVTHNYRLPDSFR